VVAQCVEDAYEPDDACSPAATILEATSTQTHGFCDDAEDWLQFNACAGRPYSLSTVDLELMADTGIELFGPGCDTSLALADDGIPGAGARLDWIASLDGTYHVRVFQSDGSSGLDRAYEVALEGDTSPCATWARELQGAEIDTFRSVVPLEHGGFVLGGTTASGGAGGEDLLLAEYDAHGNLVRQWTVGGPLGENGQRLRGTPDGGFLMAGWTYDPGAPIPEDTRDGLAIKFDGDWNVEWARSLGGSERDEMHGLAVLEDGTSILVGLTESAGNPAGARAWAEVIRIAPTSTRSAKRPTVGSSRARARVGGSPGPA